MIALSSAFRANEKANVPVFDPAQLSTDRCDISFFALLDK